MQSTSLVLLSLVTLFLVLILHAEESQSLYPYTIRGFVTDVRSHPLRFIGGLFFKKAFLLKKLKLKWKLKKKFVLKKLLKKLFLGQRLELEQTKRRKTNAAFRRQIFALLAKRRLRQKTRFFLSARGAGINVPDQFHQWHPHNHSINHVHHHFHDGLGWAAAFGGNGRKRRAIRFPDEEYNGSGSSSSSLQFSDGYDRQRNDRQQHLGSSSSGSRTFFDEESFSEFRRIGLGQHELDMLRRLPEDLQYEYRQEMQELETSASEPREADIMEYLTVTNEFDTDHCIAKGICEVMARGNRTSNQFENLLLEYYNEEPEARKDPKGSAAYVYDYAAFLGKSRRDSRACANYFPKCPEPTNQLTSFMNDIFSSEMCDPPVRNEL